MPRWLRAAARAALVAGAAACSTTVYRASFYKPPGADDVGCPSCSVAKPNLSEQLDREAPFLKCHLRDGGVIVLEHWSVDAAAERVKGSGIRYDVERKAIERRAFDIAVQDVALFETNRPEKVSRTGLVVMGTVTGVSLALTALCITSPKTCFGSCPTFYGFDGSGYTLQAEGFSSSIARALESTDVDALFDARLDHGQLKLWVTNEAPETHAIRALHVLAAERPPRGRVYRAGSAFFAAGAPIAPSSCRGLEGDCRAAVAESDELEYLSRTDGVNLLSKEVVELTFERAPAGPLGVVIAARNGLLNSFLLYQALANMGTRMGDYLAELERSSGPIVGSARALDALLGDLELEVLANDGAWKAADRFVEVGPIAREVQLLRLPQDVPRHNLQVRLRQTRGNFKVDQLALVPLLGERKVERLGLRSVTDERGEPSAALSDLQSGRGYLVTQPGDAYQLEFEPPACTDCELFLEARGYYYEWGRDVWFPEENERDLLELFLAPEAALVRLAPAYQRIENDIERLFFQSRVRTHMHPPGVPR